MTEDILPETDVFSPILIKEYIRLITAAECIKNAHNKVTVKFKITPDVYQKLQASPIQAPLIGLITEYSEQQGILSITAEEEFIKSYENKIQEEVALNFAQRNIKRYSKFISLV